MEIPVGAIANSIGRGDILLSEFDGIDHRKFFVVMGVSEEKVCGFFLYQLKYPSSDFQQAGAVGFTVSSVAS